MLYWSSKFANMNIITDKRKTNIIYVDKNNNHVANNDDILKLINTDNSSNIDVYIGIIAGANNLNETEIAVLKYILNNNGNNLIGQVCVNVARIINKSTATVARAITSLRDMKLIYGNGANTVKLSSSITTNIETLSKAKFIVIELNPEITSNSVSI